ncbi:two component, sigma54 specific, transcriptional regulator, Fis family [Anaeromyxobacter sp. K]|uniref:sigma-54-dependent transcriptional regulator n=1 Tax=Anaeromyxobacter sp. (strain K) TaxID=447217 RepID=UPI00015F9CFB|nr:sigma-54 dependent transcriptional regulator [Anaeromyxobacter sp. K]ACG71555.1 two component, sigma54 specific, transcriptional regulator, Fis family [Anaeromyxobacter sp. K]
MTGGPVRVLVADDKENMRKLLAKILADGYAVEEAEDGARALSLVATRPYDVVVTDIRMPGADGFELLGAVKARAPDTEVVMMTGYATIADAVRAMRMGAFDYLEKPFDPDAALAVVARAAEHKRLADAARRDDASAGEPSSFHNLVGRSARMRAVYGLLDKAAGLDITVLLLGETGTGKELAARAIHYHSARRERRFVPVNCGALPAELVESELFGHARGAFTGAAAAKAGLFEEAQGGSLFLDEVGELPLPAQVKLNRALQEREIRRVGDTQPLKVDVRVIAATHRDLREEVRAGRFREDLFYRLHVFPVTLPPLRERAEDVPLLAQHFLAKHARALRRELAGGFEPEALRRLAGYPWPGNVRELENAVERAVAVSSGDRVRVADLPAEVAGAAPVGPEPADLAKLPYKEAVAEARDRTSREYLVALLAEFGGNVTRAAERAGMERESLHRLLRRYGLRSDDFK